MNHSSASSFIVFLLLRHWIPCSCSVHVPTAHVSDVYGRQLPYFCEFFSLSFFFLLSLTLLLFVHRDADKQEEEEKARGNGTMWAQFPGDFKSPLRPKSAQEFEEQGYRRAHEGVQIMRDKAIFEKKRLVLEEYHNLLYVSTHVPCLA